MDRFRLGRRQQRTSVQRVVLHTRWILYGVPWTVLVTLVEMVVEGFRRGSAPIWLMWVTVGLIVTQTALATTVMAYSIGYRRSASRATALVVAVSATLLSAAPVLRAHGWLVGSHTTMCVCALVMVPLAGALAVITSVRTYTLAATITCALVVVSAVWSHSVVAESIVASFATWLFIGIVMRSSVWFLSVMRKFDAAREAEAQLAVTEERLRFARDLHDVMGRNLAIITLKSELAARLGEAQDPRAIVEIADVERLARQSQNEFRDVVRGYRTTDFTSELVGAHNLLQVAGISSNIENHAHAPLPDPAEAALGWVVREGVTNVLRHSEARRCTIRLTHDDGFRLVILNDGVRPAHPAVGAGLAGLSQRLAPLGGTLCHGPGPKNSYRLTAQLPSPSCRKDAHDPSSSRR
ncbi:histidine kinase [Streptomyces sp. SID8375]|uniref:sensor histidine kinase n=1 Tax=unclassified Streptomyces TaxID=2593676 RepID=UPI000997C3F0|nr:MULTISPECIES: histidine kinase [unclassified Streptomyces]MYX09109.1 histidine kinase [Streptomyces sp. SID8375]